MPVNVGVGSAVSVPLTGAVTVGAAGARVSTVKVTRVGALWLPAPFPATTATVCRPADRALVAVQDQFPLPSAVVTQSTGPLGWRVTVRVLPASAVPVKVGVGSLIVVPLSGAVTRGAASVEEVLVSR